MPAQTLLCPGVPRPKPAEEGHPPVLPRHANEAGEENVGVVGEGPEKNSTKKMEHGKLPMAGWFSGKVLHRVNV